MSVHQYIGARYVPYYYENSLDPASTEWEPNVNYEALTVVTLPNQHSYISKKAVPDTIGTPAANAEYWLDQGARDAYIQDLQDQIDVIDDSISSINNDIEIIANARTDKKLLCIGDSYADNPRSTIFWTNRIAAYYPGTRYKALPGSGFSTGIPANPNLSFKYLLEQFVSELTADECDEITDIIVCGGWNDGRMVVHNLQTYDDVVAAIKSFVDYANIHFKNAIVHIGFIAWQTPDNTDPIMANLDILRNICYYYEHTRYKNLHVLEGVSSIMHNCAFMDSTYFHPNDNGGRWLAIGILNAIFGGFNYKNRITLSNSLVIWNPDYSGTLSGYMETDGDIVNIYMMISGLTGDTSQHGSTLFTFKEDALPWAAYSNVMLNCYDATHDKPVFFYFEGREAKLNTKGGDRVFSSGTVFINGMLNNKYC